MTDHNNKDLKHQIKVNVVKIQPNAILPKYQTIGSSGMDLHAYIENPLVLKPNKRVLIKTGVAIHLPNGLEAQVRSRSGLANKYGVCVLNSPGTIDNDYRGEIGVILINLGEEDFTINNGDRIAQLIIANYLQVSLVEVEKLDDTKRGSLGFGSTGL